MTSVIVINSSPRMKNGNTALILNPFIEGMKEAGAEVEIFYTQNLKINPCQGDYACAIKTPGKCFQKDDMQNINPKLYKADIWVFATPLFVSGMTGPMKNLIDRILIPIGKPKLELLNGHCHHPLKEVVENGKIILVSNCGYWELDNFNLLVEHIKALCSHAEREFAGALLRPHGPALRSMLEDNEGIAGIFEAAKNAGQQLIQNGKMDLKTLKIISRELLPLEEYV